MTCREAGRALGLVALMACLPGALSAQVDASHGGWRETGERLVPRLRLTLEILDSQPAVLEAAVERGEAGFYIYSVDWGDGGRPEEGRRHDAGPLRLTHDYDRISTFRVALEVRVGKEVSRVEAGLVTVRDDDSEAPRIEWSLPPPVVKPGEPAVVGWKITDPSGLDFVMVTLTGPNGPLQRLEKAEGRFDISGRGLGTFGVEVQTGDADRDRPSDGSGFMLIEIVTVTDDLDADGLLDYLDNCPRAANRDQRDRDNDGLGDACDPCPEINGRCPEPRPGATGPPLGGPGEPPLAAVLVLVLALVALVRRRRGPSLALAALVLLADAAAAAPVITRIRPSATLVGEPVVITGTGFGATQGANGRVTFGGVDAGTVYHWTDTRITVEVPVGFLVAGVPTPTPTGTQPVVVRTSAGESSPAVNVDIKIFRTLPPFRAACRCGDPGCSGPCLPDDYCRQGAGGCSFDSVSYGRRDIKDVDFGDVDNDGDLDVLDVSSPMCETCPGGVMPGWSPGGCSAAVNFPDRLFLNDGSGRFADVTGGADGDYGTAADNPIPFFHSFRTYDADFVDVNNDGFLDLMRADRALCGGDPSHYFKNVDTSGDGVPDTRFQGFALPVSADDAYWDNVATGDVEGDGDLDLLISHSAGTTAPHSLEINNGSGSFTLYTAAMAPTHSASDDFTAFQGVSHDMALVDLDNDRDLDILLGGGNHGTALPDQVLLNRFAETGELFFESVPVPRAAENSTTVHVGAPDLNGDGRPDAHFGNYSGVADRLYLNLGRVDCTAACGDGLTCPASGLVVRDRICWSDASLDLPEEVAGTPTDVYGADYGDIDADGDLDILVTGLEAGGNFLFLNRAGTACTSGGDCPAGYNCVGTECRPSSASTAPKWWSCPQMGGGASAVPCRDRNGAAVTGPGFPAAREDRRSLAVVFGDVDGDVDLDVLWARGQWGPSTWERFPDAGPLLLIGDSTRPYVKRATVYSGARIVYQATWTLNGAGTQIDIAPATFAAAAPFTALRTQDVHIELEFSEAMAAASLAAVAPLGTVPTLSSSQPAGAQTVWRATISNLDIADDGSEDGTHMITVAGSDMAGNQLLQVNARASIAVDALRGTPGQDTIHGFRIGPLAGVIPVTALFVKRAGPDPATPAIADKALALQTALNNYFGPVSYNEISFAVTGHGWLTLDQPLAWYSTNPRTPLVDLVQEALGDAQAASVDLSATNYVLVVTDETAVTDEWSTTGGWPYTVGGGPRLMAAGVVHLASSNARVTHAAGRLVGLIDLFEHPEVTASRPFVGPWSHMSDRETEVHPLGWEKWRAGWVDETGTATNKTLTRVPKPPAATPIVNQTHTLLPNDSNDDGVKMVAVELAGGLHFTAEYRRQQGLDSSLPDAGVVIVKANDVIPMGEGPAIVQESGVTAGNLADAPFVVAAPRNAFDDVGTGVRVSVLAVNPGNAQIRLDYAVPPTQNDVYVEPWNERYVTEDIWVDAPDASLAFAADPLSVRTANERPVVGYLNRVYGRVRNAGRADATNFEVELEILEPWGPGGPWRSLKVDLVPLLQGQDTNPGAQYIIMAEWTPTAGEHTCVRLRVRGLANDVNPANNEAQENIDQFASSPGSPYSPVTTRFQVENPFDETVPLLFRLDGLPPGWSHTVTPARPLLAPRSTAVAQLTLQPAEGAPLCSSEQVTLTAWAPRVDTLKRVGTGITLAVELKSPAAIDVETRYDCKQSERLVSSCSLVTRGCTNPGLPNTEIAIVYTAPDGSTAVRYVMTDAAGCFVDVQPGAAPGLWQVGTVLEEEDCRVGVRTPPTSVFVPPTAGFGRPRSLGVFTGGNWPVDGLDDHSASFMFAGQFEWALTTQLRLGMQVGYHAFDAEPPAVVDNLGFTNLAAIARWRGAGVTLKPYALVGFGAYRSSGSWDAGFQAGVGLEVPLTDAVSLATGVTAHQVNRGGDDAARPRWIDAYLGFVFGLP